MECFRIWEHSRTISPIRPCNQRRASSVEAVKENARLIAKLLTIAMLLHEASSPELIGVGDTAEMWRDGSCWHLPARVTHATPYYFEVVHNACLRYFSINRTRTLHSDTGSTDEEDFGNLRFSGLDEISKVHGCDDNSDHDYTRNDVDLNKLSNERDTDNIIVSPHSVHSSRNPNASAIAAEAGSSSNPALTCDEISSTASRTFQLRQSIPYDLGSFVNCSGEQNILYRIHNE